MNFMGIDHHKQYSELVLVDEDGNILKREKVLNHRIEVEDFLREFENEITAVVEASRGSYVMADMLEEMGIAVKMAHPIQVKAIAQAKIKTDKRSAKVLADLLRTNLIPEVYMRSRQNREAQWILRQRAFYVGIRTKVKNRISWLLIQQREEVYRELEDVTDLFSRRGMELLKHVELPKADRKLLDLLMETHSHLDKTIKRSDGLVAQLFKKMKEAQLISSIPGFGPFFSVLVATEIGDINRFPEVKKLHAYAGVIPSTHSSGGKTHHGKIIKSGNKWLRWAAVEAVWPAMRADFEIKLYYLKRMRPKGPNVAKVATARKLLSIVYRVLKEKQAYEMYRKK